MTPLLHHLLRASLVGGLLILLLLLVRRMWGRRLSGRFVYAAWLLAALRLAVPFSFAAPVALPASFSHGSAWLEVVPQAQQQIIAAPITTGLLNALPRPPVQPTAQANAAPDAATPNEVSLPVPTVSAAPMVFPQAAPSAPLNSTQMVTLLWAAGALGCAAYMLLVNLRFGRRIKKSQQVPLEAPESLRAQALFAALKLRPIQVFYTRAVQSPCLYGILRPRVALPWGYADIKHALLHELCHWRVRDTWWALLRNILCCAYWFHPLVWLAARRSLEDSEYACDERTLRYLAAAQRVDYAQALVRCASSQKHSVALVTGSFAASQIKKRVERILARRPLKRRLAALLAAVLLALCAFSFSQSTPPNSAASPAPASSLALADVQSLQQQVYDIGRTVRKQMPLLQQMLWAKLIHDGTPGQSADWAGFAAALGKARTPQNFQAVFNGDYMGITQAPAGQEQRAQAMLKARQLLLQLGAAPAFGTELGMLYDQGNWQVFVASYAPGFTYGAASFFTMTGEGKLLSINQPMEQQPQSGASATSAWSMDEEETVLAAKAHIRTFLQKSAAVRVRGQTINASDLTIESIQVSSYLETDMIGEPTALGQVVFESQARVKPACQVRIGLKTGKVYDYWPQGAAVHPIFDPVREEHLRLYRALIDLSDRYPGLTPQQKVELGALQLALTSNHGQSTSTLFLRRDMEACASREDFARLLSNAYPGLNAAPRGWLGREKILARAQEALAKTRSTEPGRLPLAAGCMSDQWVVVGIGASGEISSAAIYSRQGDLLELTPALPWFTPVASPAGLTGAQRAQAQRLALDFANQYAVRPAVDQTGFHYQPLAQRPLAASCIKDIRAVALDPNSTAKSEAIAQIAMLVDRDFNAAAAVSVGLSTGNIYHYNALIPLEQFPLQQEPDALKDFVQQRATPPISAKNAAFIEKIRSLYEDSEWLAPMTAQDRWAYGWLLAQLRQAPADLTLPALEQKMLLSQRPAQLRQTMQQAFERLPAPPAYEEAQQQAVQKARQALEAAGYKAEPLAAPIYEHGVWNFAPISQIAYLQLTPEGMVACLEASAEPPAGQVFAVDATQRDLARMRAMSFALSYGAATRYQTNRDAADGIQRHAFFYTAREAAVIRTDVSGRKVNGRQQIQVNFVLSDQGHTRDAISVLLDGQSGQILSYWHATEQFLSSAQRQLRD